MSDRTIKFLEQVLKNMPASWLEQTTHRLDIYDESLAKIKFLTKFEELFNQENSEGSALENLPTAYDYIRLGHPLSCLLEWAQAKLNKQEAKNVISFSSETISILAILRKNLIQNTRTQILYTDELPSSLDEDILKDIYNYKFNVKKIECLNSIPKFDGSTIFISQKTNFEKVELSKNIDFLITIYPKIGSITFINGKENENYISEIQHVRRRETIAMTPANCLSALNHLVTKSSIKSSTKTSDNNKASVLDSIKKITGTNSVAILGSCGLSIQYAILMGLIHHAKEKHKEKMIKIVVPPNCYGGTNDQARRVAACIANVEVMDLPVDGGNDMVKSTDRVLEEIAKLDAIPYIIAEIPTNPRVEVPELIKFKEALSKERKTKNGQAAISPVFILDQTFCPNIHFLGEEDILSSVQTISYVSGSKFPSGGLCTAGYCVANKKSEHLMEKIDFHLKLCGNEATDQQIEVLAKQIPSMNERIDAAYRNTREFVDFISEALPEAKINFVSKELAKDGFTPSVFSLDLPTKGNTSEEKESYKRDLNYKLINLMIEKIPNESKYCVSYGQLNGCYWTIPATSTQGTTKEGDKDYIVRVAISANMNVELHKKVFLEFVQGI